MISEHPVQSAISELHAKQADVLGQLKQHRDKLRDELSKINKEIMRLRGNGTSLSQRILETIEDAGPGGLAVGDLSRILRLEDDLIQTNAIHAALQRLATTHKIKFEGSPRTYSLITNGG